MQGKGVEYKYISITITMTKSSVKTKVSGLHPTINLDDRSERKAWEKKWDALQAVWSVYDSWGKSDDISVPIKTLTLDGKRSVTEIDGVLGGLQRLGCFKSLGRKNRNYEIKGIDHTVLHTCYQETRETYKKFADRYQDKVGSEKFKLSIKDREIWINEYIIGRPYATGSNLEFLQYVRSKTPGTVIDRADLPVGGRLSLGVQVGKKPFSKILSELGFKGELLKMFFSKHTKSTVAYRGDELTVEDLKKAGVSRLQLQQQLEAAHTKNHP